MTHLSPSLQVTLIEHVAHLTSKDYAEVPKDLVALGFVPEKQKQRIEDSNVVEALSDIYGEWALGGGANRINVPEVVDKIKALSSEDEAGIFQIPPYFVYIGKAFSVLEGIGLQNDPDYSVINACLPYVSRRLIADDSERMSGALQSFVFGKDKGDADRVLDVDRLEQLVGGFSQFSSSASGDVGNAKSRAARLEEQADDILDLILSDEGVENPIVALVLEQLAKTLAAQTRQNFMDLRRRSGFPRALQERTLLGAIIDPIGLFRTSAIANVDETDIKVLETSARVRELLQELGGGSGKIAEELRDDEEMRAVTTKLASKVWERRDKLGVIGLKVR